MLLLSICGVVRQHGKMHRINNQIYEWLICEKILEYNLIKDTTMKIKLLASSIVMAGAIASQSAWAVPFTIYSGDIAGWEAGQNGGGANIILDSLDSDSKFIFTSTTLAPTTPITITEEEIGGVDRYAITTGSSATGGLATGSSIDYTIQTLPVGGTQEFFTAVKLDTDTTIGSVTSTTKTVTGDFSGLLTSISGAPQTVNIPGSNVYNLNIVDAFTASNGGLNSVTNSFEISNTVPEPMTLSMMGLGFAAFGYSRRRKAA
jgi:hypothetical protein